MSESALRDKLLRLRRTPDVASGGPEPVPDIPTLKQRLEGLIASRLRPPGPPLERVAPGRVVTTPDGEFYLLEHSKHLDSFHGDVPLARLMAVPPESLEILAGDPELVGFDLSRAAFLDTETTGLAGGSGTAAFLIGVGFIDEGRFVVRQYFMRDYNEERAMLGALARDLARFTSLVTYNGKMFDVPLLETRFRLNRGRFPISEAPHLDLLHPARRLWKLRLESCRLQSLESALLGVSRHADIPGEEIPRAYFRYVRSRDPRAVGRIFEHNRDDILSLAALLSLACQWVHESRAEDARDVFSLGRVFERAKRYERSLAEYKRALANGSGPVRVQTLMRLASHAKRNEDRAAARQLWEEAAREGCCAAFRELAIHHERRERDAHAALRVVDAALVALADRREQCCLRAVAAFLGRRARLRRRVERAAV